MSETGLIRASDLNAQPRREPRISSEERRAKHFLAKFLETGNAGTAYHSISPSTKNPAQAAQAYMRRPAVRQLIERSLVQTHKVHELVPRTLMDALQANLVQKGLETTLPDHTTRLKALELLMKVLRLGPTKAEELEDALADRQDLSQLPEEVLNFMLAENRAPTPEELGRLLAIEAEFTEENRNEK